MSTRDLLFELGTEELPAGELAGMAAALHDSVIAGLGERGLGFVNSRWFATPRRLAVLVESLDLSAPDIDREILGPPVAASKDADGNWTAAAQGFARKQSVSADDLLAIDTDKGPRLGLRRTEPGADAAMVAPAIIAEAVRAIPVSKRMRWGRSREEFLRPVQWLVLMLDDAVLPLSLFGLESSSRSRGHRFHHPQEVTLATAGDYVAALGEARVMADFAQRRAEISRQVTALAGPGEQAVVDDDLLDEVCGLVEFPAALRGTFDPAFLDVPAAALISSMKEHQKYFHLVSDDGGLLPAFITVANIESANPMAVVAGNERVIRPRLSDAKFFFETDKESPLADLGDRLNGVVFQQKLGSLADKRDRMTRLTGEIAEALGAEVNAAKRAATLAKNDLVSNMVLEFPELQGVAGAHYARHDGEPNAVADAIEQHYWPRFAGDGLPQSAEATCVALADRLDTLVGIFGIGLEPSGSKDPFALRRAALAVIRLVLQGGTPISLDTLTAKAAACYPQDLLAPAAGERVVAYIIERLRAWYEDQGIHVEVLRAVTATGVTTLADIDARVRALAQFADSDAASVLAAANKRVANMLAKSDAAGSGEPSTDALVDPAELALFDALIAVDAALEPQLADADYVAALDTLATLRAPVDAFFDDVMVNVDDSVLRENRLRLLAALRSRFMRVADIAHLAVTA